MPEDIANFHELYAHIMPTLPIRQLAEAAQTAATGRISVRLRRAFRAMVHGTEADQRLAYDWIVGARPGLRELRAVTGIDSRIESDSDAEGLLSELIQLGAATE